MTVDLERVRPGPELVNNVLSNQERTGQGMGGEFIGGVNE